MRLTDGPRPPPRWLVRALLLQVFIWSERPVSTWMIRFGCRRFTRNAARSRGGAQIPGRASRSWGEILLLDDHFSVDGMQVQPASMRSFAENDGSGEPRSPGPLDPRVWSRRWVVWISVYRIWSIGDILPPLKMLEGVNA
jgi:hypothetical protein